MGWTARGNGYRVAVGASEVEIGLREEQLRIRFVGAEAKAPSVGLVALPGKVNYFVGDDPTRWLRDISTYGRVRYNRMYPGVDIIWYGKQGQLEYDLDLEPGADASRIAMRFEGARKLALEANGDLRVEMAGGSLSLKLPEVYQEGSGGRRRVEGRYDLRAGNEVGFRLAAYDKSRRLVIDPTLVYATYFGSGLSLSVKAVSVDGSGNVYISGYAPGGSIPTVDALQPGSLGGNGSAYISKFDPTGKTLLYSTYLGGSQGAILTGMAADSAGNLIGVGTTTSTDFPLVNPVRSTFGGQQAAFALKMNAAGSDLVYSTYLSGTFQDSWTSANAVALDASGNAYITGSMNDMPTTPGALASCSTINGFCAFVVKLSNTGGEIYAAAAGGSVGNAIVADAQGAAYVAGATAGSSFPNNPPGAQKTHAGGAAGFVMKLSPDASSLVYATFLGGGESDSANAIALGAGGVVYFGGQTSSPDLPVTTGAIQGTYGGNTDAFVASLSADGTAFGFVTYLGGGRSDAVTSLLAGPNGLIVAGNTSSWDFPVSNALQPAFPGPPYTLLKSTNSGATFMPADSGLPFVFSNSRVLPDPTAGGVIVLDTGDGIYRSADDGTKWSSVEPYSNGTAIRSLSNPSVLYATGYNAGCDLFKSTDGGQTWSTPCYGLNLSEPLVGISPTDPNTVLLFDSVFEYRSTNGGQSFQQEITLPFSMYSFQGGRIVASPDGSMYATTGDWGGGLYKSPDAGLTWTQLLPGLSTGYLQLALSPSNPSILYVSYLYGPGNGNVYKSMNAGATWNQIATGVSVNYLAVDPSNAQTVYGATSSRVFVSTDGGATWTPTGASVDTNSVFGITINPANGEIYLSSTIQQTGFLAELSTDGKTLNWSTYYGPYGQLTMDGLALAPSGNVWVAGSVSGGSLPITPDARNGNSAGNGMGFLASISDATAACSYTINPAAQYSYSAGKLVFSVTAPSGCAWTATPSGTWIHPVRSSGTGSGTIPVDVDANTTGSTRTGAVSVNGQVYTITQPPPGCTYQLSNPTATSAGGTVTITVTAPAGCPWDVELQNGDPATVTSATTGTGNGTVTISIPPDSGVQTSTYSVLIGGQYATISQLGACIYTLSPLTLPATAGSGLITLTINMAGCPWSVDLENPWLSVDGPLYYSPGTISYTVTANLTGAPRVQQITLNGNPFTITQAATPLLGTSSLLVGSTEGTSSVALAYYAAWTATANDSFLHIPPGSASGTGNAVVVFTYDSFAGTGSRSGTLTIAGQTVTVTQAGANYIGPYGSVPLTTLVSSGLNGPFGLAVDGSGDVFFADMGNSAIKEWSASTQQVTTLVSSGLACPRGVAVDASGHVYFADTGNNAIKEWVPSWQQAETLVSSGLFMPYGVAVDSSGNVYIADSGNSAIKEWSPWTGVTPLVSSGLNHPDGIAVDVSGNIYIADTSDVRIKEWNASAQQLTTLAFAGLYFPTGVAVDGSGNVYIADPSNVAIDEWSASTQQLTKLASAGLTGPFSVAVDGSGNVYIADLDNNAIKEIPYTFVGPARLTEAATAGTDSLLPVLPSTASLTGVYAPASDQNWLTIGTVANGVVSFSFSANTSGSFRVAHITILGQQITVTQNGPTVPTVHIDSPAQGATISGTVTVSGWAINNDTMAGTPIGSVHVLVDRTAVGTATYGVSRPDVCAAYPGRPSCPNVGYTYSLNTATLTPGSHTLTVTATDSASPPDTGSASVTVFVGSAAAVMPSVFIDSPAPGATVSGVVTVEGWAIDNASTVGTAISSVQVLVDGTAVGTANYGVNRPDVCAAFPGRPGCPDVGFTYSLNTAALTAGLHSITVTAKDSASPPDSGSAKVTIIVGSGAAVIPTVHIDSPAPGATVSGTVTISGWAIDNDAKVGTAIGSVHVLVDGTVVGTATYGASRPDVCAAYPDRPGCPNVGFTYSLNMATLASGSHTITVTATDSASPPDTGSATITVMK